VFQIRQFTGITLPFQDLGNDRLKARLSTLNMLLDALVRASALRTQLRKAGARDRFVARPGKSLTVIA
jgi:hypothetical protein